jgi:hypothetical protein
MTPLAILATAEACADAADLRLDLARQELTAAEAHCDEAHEAVRAARRALAASHAAARVANDVVEEDDEDTATMRRWDAEYERGFHQDRGAE